MTRIANLDRIPDCTNCIIFGRSLVIVQPALQRSVYRLTHNAVATGGMTALAVGRKAQGPTEARVAQSRLRGYRYRYGC
jgi:hypothetical protein